MVDNQGISSLLLATECFRTIQNNFDRFQRECPGKYVVAYVDGTKKMRVVACEGLDSLHRFVDRLSESERETYFSGYIPNVGERIGCIF